MREAAPGCQVIGKVERREALDALASIARLVDAIWICRGDLGAQIGPAALGRAVARAAGRRCLERAMARLAPE